MPPIAGSAATSIGSVPRSIKDPVATHTLRLDLGWLMPRLRRNAAPVPRKAAEMLALVDDTIDSVRRIAARLRPPVLEDLGLAAAVDALLERVARKTGLATTLQADGEEVPAPLRRPLYRIVQEALTNIVRHAEAEHVVVRISSTPERVLLEVTDDGRGMPQDSIRRSGTLGLVGMRERAAALGADFEIDSTPGGGTLIRVWVPR